MDFVDLPVEKWMRALENARRFQGGRSADAKKFFDTVSVALKNPIVNDSNVNAIAELILCCMKYHFYVQGDVVRASHYGKRAVEITKERGSLMIRRMALTMYGGAEIDIGRYGEGIAASFDGYNLAVSLKDSTGQAICLQNISVCLIYISQFNAAERALNLALRKVSEGKDTIATLTRFAISTNVLLCCVYQEKYLSDESGIQYCESLMESQLDNAQFTQTKVLFLSAAIRYYLSRRMPLRAGKYRDFLQALTKDTQNPIALRERAFAEAMWLTASNDPDAAIDLLEDVHMKTRGSPHARTEIFMALITALNRKGETQRAQRYADEMLLALHHTQQQKLGGQLASLREVNLFRETLVMDHSAATSLNTFDVMPHTRAKLNLERLHDLEVPDYSDSVYQSLLTQSITAEIHDDSTGMHCSRVGRVSGLIAQALNLPVAVTRAIRYAAQLHDIGKLSMPSELLRAPRKLTSHERKIIEQHTVLGAKMIEGCATPELDIAYEVALYHHEWWDGTGYPSRLRGEDIPLSARIVALADVYDALTHKRPYKSAWTHGEALQHMASLRGTHFQPALFDIFVEVISPLWGRLQDSLDQYLANDPMHPLTESQLELVNAGKRLHGLIGESASFDNEDQDNFLDEGPDTESPFSMTGPR